MEKKSFFQSTQSANCKPTIQFQQNTGVSFKNLWLNCLKNVWIRNQVKDPKSVLTFLSPFKDCWIMTIYINELNLNMCCCMVPLIQSEPQKTACGRRKNRTLLLKELELCGRKFFSTISWEGGTGTLICHWLLSYFRHFKQQFFFRFSSFEFLMIWTKKNFKF